MTLVNTTTRRSYLPGVIGAIAITAALFLSERAEAAVTCGDQLNALLSDWHAIGYLEPSKPAQAIVRGGHGYVATGGEVLFMRNQIRLASADCKEGRVDSAIHRIDNVRDMLSRQGPGKH